MSSKRLLIWHITHAQLSSQCRPARLGFSLFTQRTCCTLDRLCRQLFGQYFPSGSSSPSKYNFVPVAQLITSFGNIDVAIKLRLRRLVARSASCLILLGNLHQFWWNRFLLKGLSQFFRSWATAPLDDGTRHRHEISTAADRRDQKRYARSCASITFMSSMSQAGLFLAS